MIVSSSDSLPNITVITPSYNSGRYIEQAILSVISQDYPKLEFIVIDGGSTDETIDILKKYTSRLTWISEKDRGQSDAINKGIRMASGDVLAYLNADDVYERGALSCVGDYFSKHANAYWATGKCRFIDHSGREIRKIATLYKNFWLWWGSYKVLMVLDYVSQPATFWHKEVIKKVGFFDEALHYAMDYDYSLRVGKFFKLCRIHRNLAAYRIHRTSKTFSSSSSINVQFDEDLELARKHGASKTIAKMHTLHNSMIKAIYNLSREHDQKQ